MSDQIDDERGFILVTSIILLAILTILGAVSFYKTNIEIKVSAGSVEAEQAFAAAQAGLDFNYAYWTADTGSEYSNLTDYVNKSIGASAPGVYINNYADKIADVGATSAAIDTWVTTTSGLRLYDVTESGLVSITTGDWGVDTYAQVAIWATSYDPATGYPYGSAKRNHVAAADRCADCSLVAYSLGRSGKAYRLVREMQNVVNSRIVGVAPLTNAPKYGSFEEMYEDTCIQTISTTPATGASGNTDQFLNRVLIDATQASDEAMISNDDGQIGDRNFREDADSNPQLTLDSHPVIAFDESAPQVEAFDFAAGATSPWIGQNLSTDPYATPLDFFEDATSQLFDLNVLREAANTIRTGTTGYVPVDLYTAANPLVYQTTGTGTDERNITWATARAGAYNLKTGNNGVPRSGTLTVREFMYNVQRRIPMYGLVRVLVPADNQTDFAGGMDCTFRVPAGHPSNTGGTLALKAYDGNPMKYADLTLAQVIADSGTGTHSGDDVGDISISSKNGGTEEAAAIIVYGSWFLDHFYDANNNGTYDSGEHILSAFEAIETKRDFELPIMVNPVLDGTIGFAANTRTDAGAIISSSGNYFGADADGVGNGQMDLMVKGGVSTVTTVDMMDVAKDVRDDTNLYFVGASGAPNSNFFDAVLTNNGGTHTGTGTATLAERLEYYYETVRASTGTDMSAFPANAAALNSFYIANDGSTTAEGSDVFHLMAPSGYVHGWKRAFAMYGAAGMEPSNWNDDLISNSSDWYAGRSDYLYVNGDPYTDAVDTDFLIDDEFADIPAQLYSGGLVDTHADFNVSGLIYTPMQVELEARGGAKQYVAGAIVTGFGLYVESKPHNAATFTTAIIYDPATLDNLHTARSSQSLWRYNWQELK